MASTSPNSDGDVQSGLEATAGDVQVDAEIDEGLECPWRLDVGCSAVERRVARELTERVDVGVATRS